MHRLACFALLTALLAGPHPAHAVAVAAAQSVYVELADSLQGTLDTNVAALRSAFTTAGWNVLAVHTPAVDRKACTFGARVLVLHDPGWARRVLEHGATAAFALPLRVVLYEDEAGLHFAAVNLRNVARTIVAETGFDAASAAEMAEVERIARGALTGRFASHPYGQVRTRGLIGRTMGVMAGGPFPEKVKAVTESAASGAAGLREAADRVSRALAEPRGRWQLHEIYRLDLADQDVIVIGVSGAAMEAKAFAIVGAGGDSRRASYRCPGLDHAAAFPLEVVLHRAGDRTHVTTVDGMYRMKLYFEDAGKMKFAANMGMPGSIENELRGAILAALPAPH